MTNDPKVIAAQNEVEARRAQLLTSAEALKTRLQPSRLGSDAWSATKAKSAELAGSAADEVAARPWLVGGVVAATALFLARKPVKRLAVDTYERLTSDDEAEKADAILEEIAPETPVAVARRAKRVAPKKKSKKKKEVEKAK